MELRELRYFVAVAETLHFGRAAERLHITQPALSRQIRALETELGVQLFQRTKRSVQLTLAGQTFLEKARQVLHHAEQAVLTTQSVARGETGQLRIGFTPSALRQLVPRVVRVFRNRYPDVQLTMMQRCTEDQVAAFRANQIDVGFLYPPLADERLVTTPLLKETLVVALPQDHPLTRHEALKLSELANESMILHPRAEGPHLYDQIIQRCEQAGFRPRVVQEAVASQTRIGLVAAGMGITLVPETLKDTLDSTVTYRSLRGTFLSLQLAIAHRRDVDSPIVQRFCKLVSELHKSESPRSVQPSR
ncbi:MAG: LysR family transcriptional regulator [Elainellaceae cyanobacterium]